MCERLRCIVYRRFHKPRSKITCKDNQGRNILFCNRIEQNFKDKLVEKHPEELKCKDKYGRNILFCNSRYQISELLYHKRQTF